MCFFHHRQSSKHRLSLFNFVQTLLSLGAWSFAVTAWHAFQVIICNVSPAKINAEETLSSLRFAERAKKIENKVALDFTHGRYGSKLWLRAKFAKVYYNILYVSVFIYIYILYIHTTHMHSWCYTWLCLRLFPCWDEIRHLFLPTWWVLHLSTEAVVNRDPKGERILELLQENKALRAKVARLEAHIDRCLTEAATRKNTEILDSLRNWIA